MDGVTRSNVSGSPLDSAWKRESPWSYLLGELQSTGPRSKTGYHANEGKSPDNPKSSP